MKTDASWYESLSVKDQNREEVNGERSRGVPEALYIAERIQDFHWVLSFVTSRLIEIYSSQFNLSLEIRREFVAVELWLKGLTQMLGIGQGQRIGQPTLSLKIKATTWEMPCPPQKNSEEVQLKYGQMLKVWETKCHDNRYRKWICTTMIQGYIHAPALCWNAPSKSYHAETPFAPSIAFVLSCYLRLPSCKVESHIRDISFHREVEMIRLCWRRACTYECSIACHIVLQVLASLRTPVWRFLRHRSWGTTTCFAPIEEFFYDTNCVSLFSPILNTEWTYFSALQTMLYPWV